MAFVDVLKAGTLGASVALFVAGTVSVLVPRGLGQSLRTRLALSCALAGSLLAALSAIGFWWQPMRSEYVVFTLLPGLAGLQGSGVSFPALKLTLFVDRLSAFFLLLLGLLSAGVALYSFVWLEDKVDRHRIAGVYDAFVLSTLVVLIVDNVYLFLVGLECMTLAFGYLTLYRHNVLLEADNVDSEEMEAAKRAFKVYLVFSHVGMVLVTAALALLALSAGNLGFSVLRGAGDSESITANAIFLLALAGFGIKGGFAPAHPWVAIVHPKSPTTTHALTLGLVIKISSFYMLLRIFFEFLPPGPWWWGALVLCIAGLTALVGVFYAITSRDLKTALANHSVENFGIILAGIGLALLFSSSDFAGSVPPMLAGLALLAGLYHLLNHAVFKGLLYLCTGAIENRTGTVELEKLGGLIHRFPWTSTAFLVGALAIAGFPPLNGFISEWLTLQTVFAGFNATSEFATRPLLVGSLFAALLMLGLAFGLTALAFVKIVGEVLLGAPRRPEVLAREQVGDVPWMMRGVLIVLAVLCLGLGVFPGLVVDWLGGISMEILPASLRAFPVQPSAIGLALDVPIAGSSASYAAHVSILPVVLLAALPLALAFLAVRRRHSTTGPVWTCGTTYQPEAMQITGSAFGFLTWDWASGTHSAAEMDGGGRLPWRLAVTETRYVQAYVRHFVSAVLDGLVAGSERFGQWFQDGDIRRYLGYLFAVFVLVLIASVFF